MHYSKKSLLSLLLLTVVSLLAYWYTAQQLPLSASSRLLTSTYTTTSTRTASVSTYCSGLTRSTLVDGDLSSMYNLFSSQMSAMISMNGNTVIRGFLNGDQEKSKEQLKGSAVQLALFIGPFIVGLILILVVSPFVLCCCACPESCPAKCCRKNEDQQYSNCQLYWPTALAILALLLCIGASIAGFSQSQMIPKTASRMSCASAVMLDDIINGNVTTNGSSFFSGLKQIDTQLSYLNSNLTTINNTMQNLMPGSANMTQVTNAGSTAKTDVAKIPNNVDAGGNMNAISYATPLNLAATTGTTTSAFPAILGSSTTGGFVGATYTALSSAMTAISAISTAASNFVSQTNNFQASVASLRTTVQNFTNYATDLDASLSTTLKTVNDNEDHVNLAVKLLYGLTIGIACVMMLSVLLIAFCDRVKCRYLLYGTCVLLFFIGTLGFLLSVVFSVAAPAVFFGCQFMDYSFSSSANFNSNFGNVISDTTMRGHISTCLPSSSGDLMTSLGGNAVNAINNLSSSLTNIQGFNVTYEASVLQNYRSLMVSAISNYESGVLNDLTDSASITIISDVSKASKYSSCADADFATDSWIPSVSQNPVYIQCQISGGFSATNTQCSGGNFAAATNNCKGCMDTTSIFNTGSYANKAAVLNALNNRYTGCNTFNDDLANIWNNYYLPKATAFSPVTSRASTATTSVNTFTTKITGTLNTTFNNAITAMSAAASSVTDGKYGLVAGLNCQLIGEDFVNIKNTFCQSVFTVAYFSRLAIGCASFGILFAMWCGTCSAVRFYKHSIRKLNSADNAGLSDDEVEDVTNTNFVKPKRLQ